MGSLGSARPDRDEDAQVARGIGRDQARELDVSEHRRAQVRRVRVGRLAPLLAAEHPADLAARDLPLHMRRASGPVVRGSGPVPGVERRRRERHLGAAAVRSDREHATDTRPHRRPLADVEERVRGHRRTMCPVLGDELDRLDAVREDAERRLRHRSDRLAARRRPVR